MTFTLRSKSGLHTNNNDCTSQTTGAIERSTKWQQKLPAIEKLLQTASYYYYNSDELLFSIEVSVEFSFVVVDLHVVHFCSVVGWLSIVLLLLIIIIIELVWI